MTTTTSPSSYIYRERQRFWYSALFALSCSYVICGMWRITILEPSVTETLSLYSSSVSLSRETAVVVMRPERGSM